MRLAIVILNFRTLGGVEDCLWSLHGEVDPRQDRVFVVDNGSQDGSLEAIERTIDEHGWNEWAETVSLPDNLGFAGGNNQALTSVDARGYLLLNSDTILLAGALRELLAGMEAHPHAGIISAGLERPDGTMQTSAFRNPSPLGELVTAAALGPLTRWLTDYEVSLPVSRQPQFPDWVCFASVLIRREVVAEVGVLDDGYFLYFEDVDYCRRARDAGWEVMVWPSARVIHLNGWPQPPSEEREGSAFWHASRARYYGKFFGRTGLWCANICWMIGRLVSFTREQFRHERSHAGAGRARRIWTNWRDPLKASSPPNEASVSVSPNAGGRRSRGQRDHPVRSVGRLG